MRIGAVHSSSKSQRSGLCHLPILYSYTRGIYNVNKWSTTQGHVAIKGYGDIVCMAQTNQILRSRPLTALECRIYSASQQLNCPNYFKGYLNCGTKFAPSYGVLCGLYMVIDALDAAFAANPPCLAMYQLGSIWEGNKRSNSYVSNQNQYCNTFRYCNP